MTQAQLLAQQIDFTRKYTLFFFSKLKDTDLHHRFELNGKKLNSAYWLMAHLTMTENWLLLRGMGGEMEKFSWAKLFAMGKPAPAPEECPPFEEVKETSIRIHEKAIEWVKTLSDTELDQAHLFGFQIGPLGTKREGLFHAIRHEAGHAGQLGILCSLHGLPTI